MDLVVVVGGAELDEREVVVVLVGAGVVVVVVGLGVVVVLVVVPAAEVVVEPLLPPSGPSLESKRTEVSDTSQVDHLILKLCVRVFTIIVVVAA